jgi:hypothetical protein
LRRQADCGTDRDGRHRTDADRDGSGHQRVDTGT